MNKQTAMQQLIEALELKVMAQHIPWVQKTLDDALEMERQQIMTAFTQGDIFGADYYDGVNITEENYYNQTFKSE